MSQVSSEYHQESPRHQLFMLKMVAWLKFLGVWLCQLMQLLIISNSVKLFVSSIAIITHEAYPLYKISFNCMQQ